MPWVAPLDNAAAAQIVCRFYQYGACRFGSTCRFIHPAAEPATLGSSCSSSSSSSTTSSGSSYHTGNSISDGSSPADSAPAPKASAGAAAPNTEQSSHTGAVDLSRWIDAPVFVPKAKLPLEQPPQPPQQQQQPRKNKRKSDRRTVVVDELQQQLRRTAMDKSQQQQQAEQEVEDTEEKPDVDGLDNEADNEADNEEEEDEEEELEEVEEEVEEENDSGGAVGGLAADAAGSPLLSYANVVTMNNNHNGTEPEVGPAGEVRLCAHYEKHGLCPLADCVHVHGELCELCQRYCLDPRDREQQRRHNADCIREHELEMEHAFAVQRSRDKSCGICLDVVMEKRAREQRFGILPNCKHTFCLSCIRTWRKATNFANKIRRGCPTCRVPSDFVCPSFVWVEAGEEKERLIENYKQACNNTDCMHFKKGAANCPFGNKCFYRHALPSGELVDLGAPSRRRNPNRAARGHIDPLPLQEVLAALLARRSLTLHDELLTSLFSDLDDSDYDLESNVRGYGFWSDSSESADDYLFDIV
ncbi:probable E3 ubiquitin-protein ligase makorin-2 [Anopheles arabiensis]|uniref:RING-type E3 ubiquitin transferase n=1 Tax=Anopheles arabiensis TaxID=7173 RepID=A0A182IAZ9_ANOAR|nr:probable E3 ubiquitin-protein ligase makorin-2 [Anopheles arabiensis]XP_040172589.1 probable E3 ubiquitin-protein ligase makorin-2 [Anopheles arabiensis]XP_040172590.1 probable E3 ubiquitin-protein ligase makorin-2 [Anopheles arabiensis]XP_040172591.1 probable E3 ubiquitin-protein ligase makorin-2 [Anopheles arabiensis]XP_040172592.1 probable E3 ubiquitin-protein ligase makorin-2 [Anopheles arabiensis]